MENEIQVRNSNENCTIKKNISTYSDKKLCFPSRTIGIKKKLHLPRCRSVISKQKTQRKFIIYFKSINRQEKSVPKYVIVNNKNFHV